MRQEEEREGAPERGTGPEDDTLVRDEWPIPPEYRVAGSDAAPTGERMPPEPMTSSRRSAPDRKAVLTRGAVGGLLATGAVTALLVALFFGLGSSPDQATLGAGGPRPTTAPAVGAAASPETDETSTEREAPDAVEVPDVSGLTAAEARAKLAEAGLEARIERSASDRPEGEVVEQAPAAGSELGDGRAVRLVVSSGPERLAVPGVVGLGEGQAARRLRAAGLEVEVTRSASTRPPGTVLHQTPAAGSRVEEEATVRLVVAAEREVSRVDVPRVVGMPVADARERLRALGLRSTVTRVHSDRPSGVVLRQAPSPGSTLREGQVVRLEVSSGPALVPVPDVVGLDETRALELLAAAGLNVHVVDEQTSDPSQEGIVLSQSPAAGSRVDRATLVTLRVARLD